MGWDGSIILDILSLSMKTMRYLPHLLHQRKTKVLHFHSSFNLLRSSFSFSFLAFPLFAKLLSSPLATYHAYLPTLHTSRQRRGWCPIFTSSIPLESRLLFMVSEAFLSRDVEKFLIAPLLFFRR